jgi:hypothetical protein
MLVTNDFHICGRCVWKPDEHTEVAITRAVGPYKRDFNLSYRQRQAIQSSDRLW